MDSVANSPNVKIVALVTGHPETKGVQFSQMYGIPKSSIYTYETFDQIRNNPDIDALYIGLPNSMHCEYTVRGAQAGKHILCEKPMAISSAECRTMIDACRKADRKLMIAYRMQYDPVWQQADRHHPLRRAGQDSVVSRQYAVSPRRSAGGRPEQYGGGGPMMDLGIYPLNGIRYFTQEEPSEFTAVLATRDKDDPRFKEVEQSVEWTMKFPSGIIASCGCSYGQFGPMTLSIHGDQGYISLNPAFGGGGIHLTGKAGDKTFDQPAPARATSNSRWRASTSPHASARTPRRTPPAKKASRTSSPSSASTRPPAAPSHSRSPANSPQAVRCGR